MVKKVISPHQVKLSDKRGFVLELLVDDARVGDVTRFVADDVIGVQVGTVLTEIKLLCYM